MKITKIIQKNLKLLMRSRTSIITTLIGPLVVIVLVGLAFGSMNSYDINVGVYAPEYNELTNSFVDKLAEQNFRITKFELERLCVDDIKEGKVHTCVIFPDKFDINNNSSKTIVFHVDESNTNVVSLVKAAVTKQIANRMQEISEDLTSGILDKIGDAKTSADFQTQIVINTINKAVEIDTSLESLSNDVASMDLEVDKSDFRYGSIDDTADDVKTNINALESRGDAILIKARAMISDVRSGGPNANITATLNSAETDLDDLEDMLNITYGESSENINTLLMKLVDLSDDIDFVTNKLNGVDLKKSNVNDKINDVSGDVAKVKAELESLKASLEGLSGDVGTVDVTNVGGIVTPIKTEVKPVVAEKAPLHYMLPSLIVLVIMFISMMLAGTMVVMERNSSAFFRNFVTPTKDIAFHYGTFFTGIIVVTLQMILVLLVSFAAFQVSILSNFTPILLILIISIALYTVIGMIIGNLFSSQEMVSLGGIFVGSSFLLLSNTFFPIQLPEYMGNLLHYNPFIISEQLLKKAILFQSDVIELMPDLFLLSMIIIVMFVILIGVAKLRTKLFFTGVNFMKRKYSTLDQGKIDELKKADLKKNHNNKKDAKASKSGLPEEPSYGEMGIPPKKGGKLSSFFKKTSEIITHPEELKHQVEELVHHEKSVISDKKISLTKESSDKSKNNLSNKKVSLDKVVKGTKVKSNDSEIENPLLSKLQPHQYFVLSSGNIVKSYSELIEMLNNMDDETFSYHVAKDKNDFFLWIKNVLKAEDVASKIEKLTDRKKMIKVLKKFI